MTVIRSFFTKLFVIAVTLGAMQLPFFVDQYLMHLEGHLEESRLEVNNIDMKAHEAGFSEAGQYIQIFLQDAHKVIQGQGRFLEELVLRNKKLEESYQKLQESSSLFRPFVFFVSYDHEIAKETWQAFAPGVMVTKAALIWAITGFVIALLLLQIPLFRRRSKAPK